MHHHQYPPLLAFVAPPRPDGSRHHNITNILPQYQLHVSIRYLASTTEQCNNCCTTVLYLIPLLWLSICPEQAQFLCDHIQIRPLHWVEGAALIFRMTFPVRPLTKRPRLFPLLPLLERRQITPCVVVENIISSKRGGDCRKNDRRRVHGREPNTTTYSCIEL